MDAEQLRGRWYMGWACAGNRPMQDHLALALARFRKRHGRLPAIVAVREKDGLAPPEGVDLVTAPWVHEGHIHLYL